MKVRSIPYGYQYVNGNIVLHPQESVIVKEICQSYLAGESLLNIAQSLNERFIEYMVGVVGWNKARIRRIIEDERYCGEGAYPVIIDKNLQIKMWKIKSGKNNQKEVDRKSDIFQLGVPVLCPICNQKMHRRCNNSQRAKDRWACTSLDCKEMIIKADGEMIEGLTELLNMVIANPDIINIPSIKEYTPSIEVQRLHNEITRLLNGLKINKEEVQEKMREYISLKYKEMDSSVSTAQRLKDIFLESSPLEKFSIDLFTQTVISVILYKDKSVGIIFTNNQIIKKEL